MNRAQHPRKVCFGGPTWIGGAGLDPMILEKEPLPVLKALFLEHFKQETASNNRGWLIRKLSSPPAGPFGAGRSDRIRPRDIHASIWNDKAAAKGAREDRGPKPLAAKRRERRSQSDADPAGAAGASAAEAHAREAHWTAHAAPFPQVAIPLPAEDTSGDAPLGLVTVGAKRSLSDPVTPRSPAAKRPLTAAVALGTYSPGGAAPPAPLPMVFEPHVSAPVQDFSNGMWTVGGYAPAPMAGPEPSRAGYQTVAHIQVQVPPPQPQQQQQPPQMPYGSYMVMQGPPMQQGPGMGFAPQVQGQVTYHAPPPQMYSTVSYDQGNMYPPPQQIHYQYAPQPQMVPMQAPPTQTLQPLQPLPYQQLQHPGPTYAPAPGPPPMQYAPSMPPMGPVPPMQAIFAQCGGAPPAPQPMQMTYAVQGWY